MKISLIYDIPFEEVLQKTLAELKNLSRTPPKPQGWDNFVWGERAIV